MTLPSLIQQRCGSRSSGFGFQQHYNILGGVDSLCAQLFEESRVGERTRERGRDAPRVGLSFPQWRNCVLLPQASTLYRGNGRGFGAAETLGGERAFLL
jgi:hypothetical protein